MGNMEVFIAPFLEAGIVFPVVLVACFFDCAVEMNCVFVEKVGGSQIRAAAEPPCVAVALGIHGLEVAVVEVYGWCIGVGRM